MRPVVWSHSSVNAYLDCHLRWYFAYVALEPEEDSEARLVGMAVHDYAEQILRGKEEAEMADGLPLATLLPLFGVFDRDILPTYRKPLLVEAPFQYELDGIPVSGIIDSLDEHDTDEVLGYAARILRDLKTTKQRPSKGRYRLQMTLYWIGATELGFPPDAAQLDYIVRTQHPYYWPEVVEPIDEGDMDVLSATLQAVQNGVDSADYEPTGLGTTACSSCGYRAICGPYQRYQELTNPIRKEARHASR